MIQLEKQFEILTQFILRTRHDGLILKKCADFYLHELSAAPEANRKAYLPELGNIIRNRASLKSLYGLGPEEISALQAMTQDKEISALLQFQSDLLHLWTGEWEKAGIPSSAGRSPEDRTPETLRRTADAMKPENPGRDRIIKLAEHWESLFQCPGESPSAGILLITRDPHSGYGHGEIRPLSLSCEHLPEQYSRHFIMFDYQTGPQNDLMYHQAYDAVYAADQILRPSRFPMLAGKPRFRLTYRFPDKETLYSGDSLGLGLGLLNIDAMSRTGPFRSIRRLAEPFAVTGLTDRDGSLRPVSAGALPLKIRAFFFSPCRKLVIAKENQKDAEQILNELQSEWPNRKYELLAFSTLSEAVHSSLFITEKRPIPRQLAMRRLRIITWRLTAIIAILAFFLSVFVDWDRNPKELIRKGSTILAYNQNGKQLWTFEWPYSIHAELNENLENPDLHSQFAFCVNLNDDKYNECILGLPAASGEDSTAVLCLGHKGNVLWKYVFKDSVRHGKNVFSDLYSIHQLTIYKSPESGNFIIVFYIHQPWYPSAAVTLNGKGEVMGQYWNPGHIYSYNFIDYDGDGTDELFIGGTTNLNNTANIAVLKWPDFSGQPPADPSGPVFSGQPGITLKPPVIYMEFPDFSIFHNSSARYVTHGIHEFGGLLKVSLNTEPNYDLFYLLNPDASFSGIFISDIFKQTYQKDNGIIFDEKFSASFINSYGRNIRYYINGVPSDYPPADLKDASPEQ